MISSVGPYGPFLQNETKKGTAADEIVRPYSEGEDSEIEIDRERGHEMEKQTTEYQLSCIRDMKARLEQQLDKMGPRMTHCLDQLISEKHL